MRIGGVFKERLQKLGDVLKKNVKRGGLELIS